MGELLNRLITDLGDRSTYDAASQCSRCGYCEQACPTYVVTGQESKSGRGRNQIVRMLLEGKLKDPQEAKEALSTCLLCGACSTACYAHVPTADIVLEGRRMIYGKAHWLVRTFSRLLVTSPGLLALLLKSANLLKRLGLSKLGSKTGLLTLFGMGGLAIADEHVEEAPLEFLEDILKAKPAVEKPAWFYFAACGSNYLYPRVGIATAKVLDADRGTGTYVKNSCCGLLGYNYGDIEDSRTLAKRNIERFEEASRSAEAAPLVGDCSSCVAFLKTYPQLFMDDPKWRKRAEAFSARVKDVIEVMPGGKEAGEASGVLTYHDSCRAKHGQGLSDEPRAVLGSCSGSFKEMGDSDCCGGAGAFSFVNPELSDEVLRRKIGRIAELQAKTVATSSTSCLIQLAHGLKKYYPDCRVLHLSELVAENMKTTDGT